MFTVVEREDALGAVEVRGSGGFASQVTVFIGPQARVRADAYAQWLNTGSGRPEWRREPEPRRETEPER